MKPRANLHNAKTSVFAAMLAASISFSAASAATAKIDENTLIEGAKMCTRYLPRHEREYGIPVHLLAAIASTESGRYHRALGLNLPWPWTVNVEGQGYFFDTKQEAVDAVRSLQARGVQSIDVGCMQVNLHHHPEAFATLDQAFDPAYNVAYGAQFLKQNFLKEGSWRGATADYHSRTPVYGEQYARLVFDRWGRIINKVAEARSGKPMLDTSAARAAMAERAGPKVQVENGVKIVTPTPASYTKVAKAEMIHVGRPHPRVAAAHFRPTRRAGSQQLAYQSPHMHMREISVGGERTHEKGVLVIRTQRDTEAPEQMRADEDVAKQARALSQSMAPSAGQPATAMATPATFTQPPIPSSLALQPLQSAPVSTLATKTPELLPVAQNTQNVLPRGQYQPEQHGTRLETNGGASKPKNIFVFDN